MIMDGKPFGARQNHHNKHQQTTVAVEKTLENMEV